MNQEIVVNQDFVSIRLANKNGKTKDQTDPIMVGDVSSFTIDTKLRRYVKRIVFFRLNEIISKYSLKPFPIGLVEWIILSDRSYITVVKKDEQLINDSLIIGLYQTSNSHFMKFHSSGDFFEGVSVALTPDGIKALTGVYPFQLKNSMVTYDQLGACLQLATKKLKSFKNRLSKFTFLYQILKNRFLSKEKVGSNSFSFPYPDIPTNNYNATNFAEKLGLSYRTLNRYFNNKLGISPKDYLKLIRFDNTCKHIAVNPYFAWSNLINEVGYYDQAHFIKEFKHMMGMTPSKWYKNGHAGIYINRFYLIME